MRSYRDQGIIISIRQFKEADKLYVIIGEKHSRIEAIAKGAGKTLSRKGGMLDLFNYCKFSFHKTKGIDLMIEADLIDDYAEVKTNLAQISELFYLAEILNHFLIEDDDSGTVLTDLLAFLNELKANPEIRDLLIVAFELKLLNNTGFLPELSFPSHLTGSR